MSDDADFTCYCRGRDMREILKTSVLPAPPSPFTREALLEAALKAVFEREARVDSAVAAVIRAWDEHKERDFLTALEALRKLASEASSATGAVDAVNMPEPKQEA